MPSHAKSGHCALTRANRVFCTDKKRIRTENTVMDKSKGGSGWLLYKIVDCARMAFSSVRNRRSARTVSRPRNIATLQQRAARFKSPRIVMNLGMYTSREYVQLRWRNCTYSRERISQNEPTY